MAISSLGDSAVKLAKTPLGIIALFVLLAEAIAAMVVSSDPGLTDLNQSIMVIFITVFPIIVVGMFWHLVVNHNMKLYAPSEFANHSDFLTANKVNPTHLLKEFKNDVIAEIERSAREPDTHTTTISDVNLQADEYARAVEFLAKHSLSKEEVQALAALSKQQLEEGQAEERYGSMIIKKLKDLHLVDATAKATDFAQLISRLI